MLDTRGFFTMLHKAITGSDARRQKAALVLKDRSFIRTIDQNYKAAAVCSVAAAHRTLICQVAIKDRDEGAYEAWLETEAERTEAINA